MLMCLHCHAIFHSKPYTAIRGIYEQPCGKLVQGRRIGDRKERVVQALCVACGGRKRRDDRDYLKERGADK